MDLDFEKDRENNRTVTFLIPCENIALPLTMFSGHIMKFVEARKRISEQDVSRISIFGDIFLAQFKALFHRKLSFNIKSVNIKKINDKKVVTTLVCTSTHDVSVYLWKHTFGRK